jgi:hypothetical protein
MQSATATRRRSTRLAAGQHRAGEEMSMERKSTNDTEAGTYDNPVRYPEIDPHDPDRQAKLAAQRAQFEADAKAGKVLCLSDRLANHGA